VTERPCIFCGQDLTGIPRINGDRRCPECGKQSVDWPANPPWWIGRPWLTCMLAVAAGCALELAMAVRLLAPSAALWPRPLFLIDLTVPFTVLTTAVLALGRARRRWNDSLVRGEAPLPGYFVPWFVWLFLCIPAAFVTVYFAMIASMLACGWR
jgi:hypothetical protein